MDRRTLVGGLLACGAGMAGRTLPAADASTVTVFAAASLTEVVGRLEAPARRAGLALRGVFAASSILARQIEQGAGADLFFPADEEWMDYLESRALLRPGTRRDVLGNRMVLVAPAGGAARAAPPPAPAPGFALAAALGRGGRLAIADPDYVPAGRYARAALLALGAWPQVERRLARAENVRAALALVARGEAPLGIVYATDARAERGVRLVGEFPAGSHPSIRYPLAITRRARGTAPGLALAFLAGSAAARAAYAAAGFTLLAPPAAAAR
ncbi:MAG: molybdate ABC transporter substrate-binding protein [Steroidobacteraceae bacterium]|nr:molybdate ABC transporter substrate-binding protein [Steroidobacteraceae bacterium]